MSTTLAVPESLTVQQQLPAYRLLLEEQGRNQAAQITGLSLDARDAVDCDDPRTEDLRNTAGQLLAAARRQLEDTEAALRRMDDGAYGLCAHCRQPIPDERLEVLPAARFCVGCQRLHTSRQ